MNETSDSVFTTQHNLEKSKIYTPIVIAVVIVLLSPIIFYAALFIEMIRDYTLSDYGEEAFCDDMRKTYPGFDMDTLLEAGSDSRYDRIYIEVDIRRGTVCNAGTSLDVFERTARFIASEETLKNLNEQCEKHDRRYNYICIYVSGKNEEAQRIDYSFLSNGEKEGEDSDPDMGYWTSWDNEIYTGRTLTGWEETTEFTARFCDSGEVAYRYKYKDYNDREEFVSALER